MYYWQAVKGWHKARIFLKHLLFALLTTPITTPITRHLHTWWYSFASPHCRDHPHWSNWSMCPRLASKCPKRAWAAVMRSAAAQWRIFIRLEMAAAPMSKTSPGGAWADGWPNVKGTRAGKPCANSKWIHTGHLQGFRGLNEFCTGIRFYKRQNTRNQRQNRFSSSKPLQIYTLLFWRV